MSIEVPQISKNGAVVNMDKKENPLAVQSKQWILTALLALMEEKSYNNISIKELTAKAALDRKTPNCLYNSEGLRCDHLSPLRLSINLT